MIEANDVVSAFPVGPVLAEQYRTRQPVTIVDKDRRTSERFKAEPGSNAFYVEGAGAIRDLSMDGVFIVDSEPLEVGEEITFSLRMGNEIAAFRGIVRRSVPQEGMGIQFTDVSREMRRRLVSQIGRLR